MGETRAVLVEGGRIAEARILPEDVVPAGTILDARLKSAGRNAIAVAGDQEYLLPKGAPGVTEGANFAIEVTREALGSPEPWKRPLARLSDGTVSEAPTLHGQEARGCELDEAGWLDLLDEARSGVIRFPGGELRVSVTPAMTLIDVDGQLPPDQLGVAGAKAAADAIRRHGVGGSIGIDLPTIEGKLARQSVAAVIDSILPQPFERTAVNGFGFLQIVRPRRHASMFELASDRAAFEARALLRQLGREVGAIGLVAHPAVISILEAHPAWLETLSRQVGGAVNLRSDPRLAISAGHAERA